MIESIEVCQAKGHTIKPIALFQAKEPGFLCHDCGPTEEWCTITRFEFRLAFGKSFAQFCHDDLGIVTTRHGSTRISTGVSWFHASGRGTGRFSGSSADRRKQRRAHERAKQEEASHGTD